MPEARARFAVGEPAATIADIEKDAGYSGMPFHKNFEINIVAALADQLIAAFKGVERGLLSEAEIDKLPKGRGVYQLYYKGNLVYVGRANNLKRRLTDHRTKINGRKNISAHEISFKCLFVHPNWTALAPEDALIRHYRKSNSSKCQWNGNGFGPHDPGRERETTDKRPDGFDASYRIKEDWVCDWITAGDWNCRDLLMKLKAKLPFLLRYQTGDPKRWQKGHREYNKVIVRIPRSGMTAKEILRCIASHLPKWQATAFPGHMILYKEARRYKHGRVISSR